MKSVNWLITLYALGSLSLSGQWAKLMNLSRKLQMNRCGKLYDRSDDLMANATTFTSISNDALPLQNSMDLDPLMDQIGDAHYVLLGEATHGTHEFYTWRAELTKRLIVEKGFSFIGLEGDWPDCYRVNESVTLAPGASENPREALQAFDRWPTWMWANREVEDFTVWLRNHNSTIAADNRVGFYGLDVYSLWDSLRVILDYLTQHQPEYVETATAAFRCFAPHQEDPQSYALATQLLPEGCEAEVIELLEKVISSQSSQNSATRNERFNAEQNALSAKGAEAYYRAMIRGGPDSWNVRDRHMVSTLERLMDHHGADAKAIVWEHNTHIGDARWTDMASAGMVNVGQLVREAHRDEGVIAVGFGCNSGRVIASDRWGGAAQSMEVPPARAGSMEAIMHEELTQSGPFTDFPLNSNPSALFIFDDPPPQWATDFRDHRAIGVVYQPATERWGNYVPTILGRRYDAFLYFDHTTALTPLDGISPQLTEAQTWPSGL